MTDDSVTIIMPAHNAAGTLEGSIVSVVEQSFANWKLIVIDDSSTDTTCEIVQRWCDRDDRILLHHLPKWLGVAAARNAGLELADSVYIAFLDSDDRWTPTKLDKQVAFLKKSGSMITFSSYYRINEQGNIIGVVVPPAQVTYKKILQSNFIGNSTAIYVRKYFSDIRFRPVGNEDHLFWIECLKKLESPIYSTIGKEVLAIYLVRPNSLSSNKFKSLIHEWNIYRNILNFNILRSIYYITTYIYYGFAKRKKTFTP